MSSTVKYVGLDVHKSTIAVAVAVAEAGKRAEMREHGEIANTPAALTKLLAKLGGSDVELNVCYEAGPFGYGIQRQVATAGHNCVVIAPSLIPSRPGDRIKTDRRDAVKLARLHRAGELTSVWVPDGAHEAMRDLIRARLASVRSLRQPMLTAWRQLRTQIAVFDKAVRAVVKASPACKLIMTVPGIGALTGLAYVSTVEDPARFRRSRSVGAHCGLTPRQYQSGQIDRSGRISRCGDILTRTLLYEAAGVIMARVKRPCGLRDWAESISKRSGHGKARVALARKLSVILHSMWRSGEPFQWADKPVVA